MPKLRVGIVNFLNSKPLAWGFLKGHHADLFAPSYHVPALVARLLGQQRLVDAPTVQLVGLVPCAVLVHDGHGDRVGAQRDAACAARAGSR